MASREELESLRQLARKRHRAATQKVSRLRSKGVDVSGTGHDPRRDIGDVGKMRTRELKSYLKKLDSFTSRNTQFVAGAKGSVLNGSLWHQAETLIKAVNKKNATPYEKIKNIFLPSQGMTVDQFMGTKPTHPVTGNPASRAPHLPIVKSPKGIPNNDQLEKLVKDLKRQLKPTFDDKIISREHRTLGIFLKDISKIANIKDISRDFKSLSKDEFSFLWNYTNFASISSFEYQIAKSKIHDPTSLSQFDAAFDTQIKEMRKIMKDVKALGLVSKSANLGNQPKYNFDF